MISVITIYLSIFLAYLYFAFVMDLKEDEPLRDDQNDEVFMEKLSLKEIKRMFNIQNHRQTIANEHLDTGHKDNNESLQLISTHSEPDVTSRDNYLKACETDRRASLTLSPNEPNIFADPPVSAAKECLDSVTPFITPVKPERKVNEIFATPSSELIKNPSCLKTPANPPLFNEPSTSSLKKTPYKKNAFKHIASPVAYYINNTPQVPLIQNTKLKKSSSIPKPVKPTVVEPSNKENINLPAVAYRSAKKTTVIDVSNGPKLPQCSWANKLTNSLPRPTIMKHAHREKEPIKRTLLKKQEDSFGDLSLHQADLSVCTKKVAF